MSLKHIENRLRLKQHELLSTLASLEREAAQLEDPARQTLEEVQYALARLGTDSYDKCIECGAAIEPAMLKAIPWTLYCAEDQQKREQRKSSAKQYPDGLIFAASA